jgi:hypothetical protein
MPDIPFFGQSRVGIKKMNNAGTIEVPERRDPVQLIFGTGPD